MVRESLCLSALYASAGQTGTIELHKRADLVLLDANPLDDIANTSRIARVVSRGRWLARAELDRRLAAYAYR